MNNHAVCDEIMNAGDCHIVDILSPIQPFNANHSPVCADANTLIDRVPLCFYRLCSISTSFISDYVNMATCVSNCRMCTMVKNFKIINGIMECIAIFMMNIFSVNVGVETGNKSVFGDVLTTTQTNRYMNLALHLSVHAGDFVAVLQVAGAHPPTIASVDKMVRRTSKLATSRHHAHQLCILARHPHLRCCANCNVAILIHAIYMGLLSNQLFDGKYAVRCMYERISCHAWVRTSILKFWIVLK